MQIIASIVAYKLIRRNAQRKVPDDLVLIYNDALKSLEKIQAGSLFLKDIPLITLPDGTQKLAYGNTLNKSYFI